MFSPFPILRSRYFSIFRTHSSLSALRLTGPLQLIANSSLFSTTAVVVSGHSRWSKIKHDKGKNDLRRGAEYSKISREIITAAKVDGIDSLRLKAALELGKKAGMTKAQMEAATRRGLGVTSEGVQFENVVIECLGPGSVALIVDCFTDSKLRTLQDVRFIIRQNGGIATPTAYLFSRKGKITLLPKPDLPEPKPTASGLFDEVFEKSMELGGVEDVELSAEGDKDEGSPEAIDMTTIPESAGAVSKGITELMGDRVKVETVGVEWVPNEDTMVDEGEGEEWEKLHLLVEKLEAQDDVSDVYTNVRWGKGPSA